jgi:uncharacterized iron-regulated membrane protein
MERIDLAAQHGRRRIVRLVHVSLGLVLGLWLVLISLTGSLIVFREELENALRPALTRVPPGGEWTPLQPVFDRVRSAFPGATFHTVNLPTAPDRSLSFWGHDASGRSFHAYVNPFSGELLGSDLADDNLTEWIYLFHAQLLGGGTGERINGLGVLAWVALLGSGVVLWVPRSGRRWREGFVVRWRAQWRRRWYDVHRAVGVWGAVPLLVVSVTGAYFPFQGPFRWLAEAVTGSPAAEDSPRPPVRAATTPWVSLDAVLKTASNVLPEAQPNWIHLPAHKSDVFTVRKRLPGEWRREGANHLHVDPVTGELLRADLHADRTPAQRLLRSMFPLHAGTFGGLGTRIAWVVLGWLPAVLFLSGFMLWWRRLSPPSKSVP